jgi:hypothetical protein
MKKSAGLVWLSFHLTASGAPAESGLTVFLRPVRLSLEPTGVSGLIMSGVPGYLKQEPGHTHSPTLNAGWSLSAVDRSAIVVFLHLNR